jgi:hypothetical protein
MNENSAQQCLCASPPRGYSTHRGNKRYRPCAELRPVPPTTERSLPSHGRAAIANNSAGIPSKGRGVLRHSVDARSSTPCPQKGRRGRTTILPYVPFLLEQPLRWRIRGYGSGDMVRLPKKQSRRSRTTILPLLLFCSNHRCAGGRKASRSPDRRS